MKAFIFLITLTCIFKISIGQIDSCYNPVKYQVNEKIDQQINSYKHSGGGVLKKSMDIKVTWDGKLIFGHERQQPLDCYTQSCIINDTIYIAGHMGNLGWGFHLKLFKDSCTLNAFALSDGNIYKYKVSDTTALSTIVVPSKTQRLTLLKRPEFKTGEVVSGYVEITSGQFYYYVNKKHILSDIKLRAYFRTEPLRDKLKY